jgi:hypothetical protein
MPLSSDSWEAGVLERDAGRDAVGSPARTSGILPERRHAWFGRCSPRMAEVRAGRMPASPVRRLGLPAWLAAAAIGVAAPDDFKAAETETALKAALAEVKSLKADLEREREAARAIAAQTAAAAEEARSAREELSKLRQQVEAVGGSALSHPRGLDQRLLDAVNDLRLAHAENARLSQALLELGESILAYLKAPEAEKPALRQVIEARLSAATEPRQPRVEPAVRIESSQVVSTQPDHKLVVINAGERSGMRIGTPLRFYRNDRPVASALVVDVREKISGALVTTTAQENEFPAVGDTIRIDTTRN